LALLKCAAALLSASRPNNFVTGARIAPTKLFRFGLASECADFGRFQRDVVAGIGSRQRSCAHRNDNFVRATAPQVTLARPTR
jgi:hypothetical protein